jgi:transcriptional regulator with XRE-family HTH domain
MRRLTSLSQPVAGVYAGALEPAKRKPRGCGASHSSYAKRPVGRRDNLPRPAAVVHTVCAPVVVGCHRGQNTMVPIVPVQCFLARTALRWTVSDLARAAELSRTAVKRFERGDSSRAATVEAIQRTLETAGVIFIDANDGGPGARLRGSGEKYHVVVTLRGLSWEWEIYRDGAPLPVPLWDGFYTSRSAAEVAGRIALREFLEALDREQKASD